MKNPLACALLCVAFAFSWQFSTVARNYGGNWTSLFCTGSAFPPPAALAGEHIYVFPHSTGYDGQFYHYVAHDPLHRGEIGRAIPDPVIRYKRILLPALVWLAAAGQKDWIDRSYIACNLFFVGLGAWYLARYLALRKAHPAFSILYAAVPATLISLDRLTIDLAFASLCVAFLFYQREEAGGKLVGTVALAALCRDTGLVLVAAGAVEACMARRFRRGLWFAAAAVPAVAWTLFVHFRIPQGPAVDPLDLIPFRGLWQILSHPVHYDLGAAARWLATSLDYLEVIGMLLAIALAVRNLRRRGFGPLETACLLWAAIALCLPRLFWADPFSPARVFTPLLLFQAMGWFTGDGALALAPLLLVAPRVWLQFAPQVLGIVGK